MMSGGMDLSRKALTPVLYLMVTNLGLLSQYNGYAVTCFTLRDMNILPTS